MISPIQVNAHRTQVLKGHFSSANIKATLSGLVRTAQDDKRAETIFTVNRNLLWHMAHCPRVEDRQAVLDIATGFEEVLEPLGPHFGTSRDEALLEAVPFSPIPLLLNKSEHEWAQRMFPAMKIDWDGTLSRMHEQLPKKDFMYNLYCLYKIGMLSGLPNDYLAETGPALLVADFTTFQQRLGQSGTGFLFDLLGANGLLPPTFFVYAEASVPSYKDFSVKDEQIKDQETGLDTLRLPLKSRNRGLAAIRNQMRYNLLSFPCASGTKLFRSASVPEEAIATYLLSLDLGVGFCEDFLLVLMLKNDLPIGYGYAYPTEKSPNARDIGLHIFREFRGTESSSRLFQALQKAVYLQFRPQRLVINRKQHLEKYRLKPENEAANTRFYEAHGFSWLDDRNTVMVRDLS